MTPDDQMSVRISHLPLDKNRLHNKQSAQSFKEHTAEYKGDNKNVNDILDQICKDNELYPNIMQSKSKRNDRGAFDAIHS